jgi:hypothetical protein
MIEMVERVAIAILQAQINKGAIATRPYDPNELGAHEVAKAAISAMRNYSEPMSQAGGDVARFDLLPMCEANPPIGQSAAERAYMAMIDAALKPNL